MQWTSAYETGIVEIDQQHQTIVGLITEFEAAINANASWDRLYPLITRACRTVRLVLSEVMNLHDFAPCRIWMQDAALSAVPFIFYSGRQLRQELRSMLPASRSASAA